MREWLSLSRSVRWKVAASAIWIVGILALWVLAMVLIPKPTPEMTDEQQQETERANNVLGAIGTAGFIGLGMPGGLWIILSRPRSKTTSSSN